MEHRKIKRWLKYSDARIAEEILLETVYQDTSVVCDLTELVLNVTEIDHLLFPFEAAGYRFSGELLSKHVLAVGQSGSGKTTLLRNLMQSVEEPFWAFDLKQDYRHLARNSDTLVLPWTELRFNPLRPPEGVSPMRWAQVFSEIFTHATALLSGSRNYLLQKVVRLYKLYDLFDEVEEPFPSLHELSMLIREDGINYTRKQSDYRDTVLNRLETMTLVADGMFDCSTGYRIEELLDRDVVFEFDGLNRDLQNFLMEALFAGVYEYRLAQSDRRSGLNHVFFLDEGKQVFSVYKERREASGIPEIDRLTAKMREFGEGLVVADQEASKLTESIKANTYTKFLLPTAGGKQFKSVAESMDLSDRQEEFARDLEIGEAVVQVGPGDPFPVRIREVDPGEPVTDEELERLQRENWEDLSSTPTQVTDRFDQYIRGEPPEQTGTGTDLSEEATRLLQDVVESPFRSLTERYDDFSSSYKGNEAKTELVDAGFVVERNVRPKPVRRKLLQLTEQGRDYVEDKLGTQVDRRGRGGVVHRFWQHHIGGLFEDVGWSASLEEDDADVSVDMDGFRLAVEVAMNDNQREVEHVQERLESGFDTVRVAARSESVQHGISERVEESGAVEDRVSFLTVSEFFDRESFGELPEA